MSKPIERRALGQDGADKLVGAFDLGFLIGMERVAVEDAGAAVPFQGGRIGEFGPVVGLIPNSV